jgi:hypothetical protein
MVKSVGWSISASAPRRRGCSRRKQEDGRPNRQNGRFLLLAVVLLK